MNKHLYDSLKKPSYRREQVLVRIANIEILKDSMARVTAYVNEAVGYSSKEYSLWTYKDDHSRGFRASLESQNDTFSTYLISLKGRKDLLGFDGENILSTEMQLPEFDGVFEDLYLRSAIQFTGNYGEVPLSLALLLSSDYDLLRPIFESYFLYQLEEVYEAYR